ncbi:hypothetical protein IFT73_06900 [Aeromicrobium sp. CFBP 8757]|uniref:hypothetical protein n=1 Tax=Aeromicrobium sp. CFBP 8757 TaxID=2775288 RepID=UPI00177AB671|nr:hypothetical protein [Aeromicrobium sp. CFBP 8757]MBD8606579.1 hypothetical protein [Aeromicrobium sp. CFBP 8757]
MRRPHRAPRDERGAIMVFTVLITTVLMVVAAFVVDLGIDRIVRTDMQSLADTTAMDVSTVIDGSKTTDQIKASSAYTSALAATLARNRPSVAATVADSDVVVTFGMAKADGTWLRDAGGAEYPNAVRVSASGVSSIRLWPGSDPAKPRRTAIAARQPRAACITAGSYLAALDTSAGGTPLSNFLNEIAPTSAAVFSSAGLVAIKSVSVPLAQLVAELNVANPSSPLDADVTLGSLAGAAVRVLEKQPGGAATGVVSELNRIASVSGSAGISETIKLGELLQLGVGNSAAVLSGDVNVFDLLTGTVMAFDGAHVVDLKQLGVTVPGFAITSLKATVVNPPKTVCGGAGSEVTASQVSLEANVTLSVPKYKKCGVLDLVCALGGLVGSLLSTLGGSWGSDGMDVLRFKLVLGAVSATTRVTAVNACEPSPDVSVSTTTSATNGSLSLEVLSPLLQVQVGLPQALASTSTHTFTQSPSTWNHVGGVGSDLVGPVSLATLLSNSGRTSAVILNGGGVNLGSQLTTALNTGLAGLGLSLNGAAVTLDKMSTCSVFGLRK